MCPVFCFRFQFSVFRFPVFVLRFMFSVSVSVLRFGFWKDFGRVLGGFLGRFWEDVGRINSD